MLRAWKVCRAFGIDVYIHWSLLLLPVLALALDPNLANKGMGATLIFGALFFSVFFCVLLHEFGHALTARVFGIGTQDITLYPIGGIARLQQMSESPLEELLIAVAGPAVNVVIAAGLVLVLSVVGNVEPLWLTAMPEGFLFGLMVINVALVLFNMIPAFPMDGGRVLRALLSMRLGQLAATRIAVAVSTVALLLLGFAAVLIQHYLLLIVLPILFVAGQAELRMVEYNAWRRQQERKRAVQDAVYVEAEVADTPALPDLVLRPAVHVYTWDHKNGVWVRDSGNPGSIGVN